MWIHYECRDDQYWFNTENKATIAVISQYTDEGELYYSFTVNDIEVVSNHSFDGIFNIAELVLDNSEDDALRGYKNVEPEELFRWIRE